MRKKNKFHSVSSRKSCREWCFRLAFGIVLVGMSLASEAETWTLASDRERFDYSTATNLAYWLNSNGEAGAKTSSLPEGDDYVFSKIFRLCPSEEGYVFPGASLTMLKGGTMSWSRQGTVTCGNLIVEGGTFDVDTYLSDGPEKSGYPYQYLRLDGKITVHATADSPLRCVSQYNSTGANIAAALHGSQDAAIVIGGVGSSQRKNSLWVFNDPSNFHGEIQVVGSDSDLTGYPTMTSYGPWFHYGLKLNGSAMPGTVRILGKNALLYLPDGGKDVSIGTLELGDKSVLRFDYSSASPHNGKYSVEDSLILNGKVTVRAVYGPSTSVGTGSASVDTPVMVGPPGVRIDASMFLFDPNTNYLKAASNGNVYPQSMSFKSVTDAATDRDTLYATIKPMLVKKGTWSFGSTSESYPYSSVTLSKGLEVTWKYDPANDDVDRQRTGVLDVCDDLAIEDGVIVKLDYKPVASVSGNETTNVVLRGPVGVRIDSSKFTFVPNEAYEFATPDTYPQRVRLIVVTDADGRDSLCAVVEPMVVSVAGDPNSETLPAGNVKTTVFEDGSKWSDGRVPHADAHYVLKHCGNFPVGTSKYVFPGKTLFHVRNYTVQRTTCDVTISNLVRATLNTHEMGIGGSTLDLRGGLTLNTNLNISTYASDRLNIHSDIKGGGNISMTPFWSTAWEGYLGLYGNNVAWTGKLSVVLYNGEGKTDYGPGRCCHILIRDGRALGGALPEITYDALYLNQRATLHAEADLTLSADVNRGLWVTNIASISVAESCEMKMFWPLTLDGALIKEGAGTLALGGDMKFADGMGGVTDVPPTDESHRRLLLDKGMIKPLSADSLDGVTVVASSGTGLVFDFVPNDERLRKYGLRNVKTKTPFLKDKSSDGKIPIKFDGLTEESIAALFGGEGLGLVTVDSSVADEVARTVDFRPVRTEKYVGFVRRDASSVHSETTFRLVVATRGGMSVVIR